MKREEMFKTLGGIDKRFIDEAESYVPQKKRRARILSVLLPAAALTALLAVSLVWIIPLLQKEPAGPTDLFSPVTDDPSAHPLNDDLRDLSYKLYSDHAVITDYRGEGSFDVPEIISGQPVTKIDMTENDAATLPSVLEMRITGKNLTELRMPANVQVKLHIGQNVEKVDPALLRSSAVTAIEVDERNAYYTAIDNVLYTKDLQTLVACPEGCAITRLSASPCASGARLPENLRAVAPHAFENCATLREILLPESVEKIGDAAFMGCTGLRTFFLPSGLTETGQQIFDGCLNLLYLETSLELDAFRDLELIIPSSEKVFAALPEYDDVETLNSVVSFFENAEEKLSYFSRFNIIPCDAGVAYDGRLLVTLEGAASLDALKSLMQESFTGDFDWRGYDPYTGKYRFAEGPEGLYTALSDLPVEYNVGERSYALCKEDGAYVLTVRVKLECGTHTMLWEDSYTIVSTDEGLRIPLPVSIPADGWYPVYILEINF